MRYLLRSGNKSELSARLEFLEQTFNLWFIPNGTIGSFTILESFPLSTEKDICLIYGHNFEVAHLLRAHIESLPEKNLYIIACLTDNPRDFIVSSKKTFIAPQEKNEGIKLRFGNEFGFDFDISDIELDLFNSRIKSIPDKLSKVFNLMQYPPLQK